MQGLLRLVLLLTAILAPHAAGANDLVASRTADLNSSGPTPPLLTDTQYSSHFLESGTYIVKILYTGIAESYLGVYSRVEIPRPGNQFPLVPVGFGNGLLGGSFNNNTIQETFTILTAGITEIRWGTTAQVRGGSIQAEFQLLRPTVPVPAPEAGAGLGAIAMAGLAYLAMKRRRQMAA